MTLDEKVFRKMGWDYCVGKDHKPHEPFWVAPDGPQAIYKELPPISSVWEVCAKFLVLFMAQKKYYYLIDNNPYMFRGKFHWRGPYEKSISAEIKNDDLAEAACKSFMEIKL